MDEEHPECVERLLRISKFENIEIRFAHINDAGITQKFKSRDGQIKAIIYINPHLPSSAAICETLAHEIAHTLHPIEWVHPWREIFAEAVSHGVMKALGIDSTNQTIHYIAIYRNDLHILETKSNEISEAIDLILRETRPKHDPPPPSPDEEPPNDT